MLASDDLDAAVRRSDPDRWLASRFIGDEAARADVIAIYAFNQELARAAAAAREPMVAEIRLTWWREALDELLAGKTARGHPVLQALGTAIQRRGLAPAPLHALIDASFQDLEPDRFADEPALEAYIDLSGGAVMALAVAVLARLDAASLRPAAQAWALVGLIRRRRAGDVDRLPDGWDAPACARRARKALADARQPITCLPVAAFPAVAHLALVRPYLAGRVPSDIEKRLRVTAAVALGRV